MSKINGLLNFIRVVFADDSRLVTKHLDVPRQIIMPGASSSSHYYNMETNYGAGTSWLKEYLTVESDLLSRYIDYEDMDDYPEIAASLDLFSDDATQPDGLTGKIVKVECKDQSINDILDDMFHKNIRIDEEIWEMARCLCKYGNNFEELIIKDGEGVVDINFMPPPTVRRVEDVEGILLGFVQDYSANFRISTEEFVERINDRSSESTFLTNAINRGSMPVRTYENWEVVHFRLRSKYRRAMYGFSVVDSVRWLMKRLLLLEDSMLIYRMTRAPERFAFYVDVGDIPPNEAVAYVKKIKNEYKKKKWIDETTGKLDMSQNILAADEDFFIPTRGDKKTTSIESIGGFSYTGIDDINYFQNKMFAGLKIPKDYLNYSDGGTTKSSLSQEDMRFARSVLRIQSVLRSGMEKMGRVHLAALGIQPDAVDWKVQMNPPSSIFELAMMEVRNAQLDLAERYKAFASQYWIMTNILHMTDEEINTINGQRKAQYLDKSNYPDFEARDYPRGFFDGNKEAEKILADNMDKVFTQSPALKHRFDELKGMMHDMKCHLHKK